MNKSRWKSVAIFAIAAPVIGLAAHYLGKLQGTEALKSSSAQRSPVVQHSPVVPNDEIRVSISSEDAKGHTQQDLDLEFLQRLEAQTIKRFQENMRERPNSPTVEFTSKANYVESGPLKFAVIRMDASVELTVLLVHAIVGKEFKRVVCARPSLRAIPISNGVCADKIKEVFGIGIETQ